MFYESIILLIFAFSSLSANNTHLIFSERAVLIPVVTEEKLTF